MNADDANNVEYYFFYCIKEQNKEYDFEYTIFKDVIKVKDNNLKSAREQAKKIMFDKHKDVPHSFRKTTGKYFYMTRSTQFDYIEIDDFECKVCGKKVSYKGIKDKYVVHGFCNCSCYDRYQAIKKEIYINELSYYIDDDQNASINEWVENQSNYSIGYIYLITNKRTGKCYVGQTLQIPIFRWWQHLKEDAHKFERKDLTDLKFEVIEIIELEKPNLKDLKRKMFEREDYFIKKYNSLIPNGYNKMNAMKKEEYLNQLVLDLETEVKDD